MNYDEAADILAHDCAFWALAFDDENYDLDALGRLELELGHKLRALGILGLLATGQKVHLHDNLIHSGDYRIQYLRRVVAAGAQQQHHYVLGRLHPIFDLIAAGDDERLKTLEQVSPSTLREPHEYPDDYYYARLLLSAYTRPAAPGAPATPDTDRNPQAWLERYSELLEPESSPRLELCQAFHRGDPEQFDEAFAELLNAELARIEERRDVELETPIVFAERQVFVEGLALLRIASRCGFAVDQEYALCPTAAR